VVAGIVSEFVVVPNVVPVGTVNVSAELLVTTSLSLVSVKGSDTVISASSKTSVVSIFVAMVDDKVIVAPSDNVTVFEDSVEDPSISIDGSARFVAVSVVGAI
jgi:hypothetical protein